MKSFKVGILVFFALIVVGFFAGTQVDADGSVEPGSADDPIITKSYVDQAVESKAVELQQEIDALKQELAQLKS